MYCKIIINIHKTLISVDFEKHLTTWIKMGISCDTMIPIFFSCQQVIHNSKFLKSMIFLTHQIHLQKLVNAIYSTFNSEIKTQLIKIYPKESLYFQYYCPLYWTYFVGGGALETVSFITHVVLLKVWRVQLLYLFLDVQVERRLPELHVLPHSMLLYTGVGKLDDPRTQSL